MNDSTLPMRRTLFLGTQLFIVSALLTQATMANDSTASSSQQSSSDPKESIAERPLEIKPARDLAAESKRALDNFLGAPTVDALLPFVNNREEIEPLIRAKYKTGKRKTVKVEGFEFASSGLNPDTGLRADMYWVTSLGRKIPVSVEETKDGFKVDWRAFEQFHDAELEAFFDDAKSPGDNFYCSLRRSHYFAKDVPNIEELHAFRVKSPIAPFEERYVFLRKDNPAAKEILNQIPWSKEARPRVDLKWVKPDDGGKPWIELTKITSLSWRG